MKKLIVSVLVVFVFLSILSAAFYAFFPERTYELVKDVLRYSADLTRKEVQVDDDRIVYLEGGKGETVVLLHGFGGDKDNWTAFARYLKGYHLVIPDVPGFGESSQRPAARYDIESQTNRIARFLEVLNLGQVHMAGNSLGGALAATYGARHPERVLTLALLDTAGAPSPKKSEMAIELEKDRNLLFTRNTKDYERFITMIFLNKPVIPTPFKKIIAQEWVKRSDFNAKIWDDTQPLQFSLAPVLSLIQAPVLIIWGELDNILDVGGVAFLEKNLKNYKTVVMKDTGHCPMIEKPEETAEVYLRFLKEKS